MLKRSFFPLICLALFVQPLVFSQTNTSTIFRFLDITPTSRASALGGNHVGMFEGNFSLMHLNPAYLSPQDNRSVSASYVNYLADANFGFASTALHIEDIGTIGIGIRYVGYGDFNRYDEFGNETGSFRSGDIALTGAYSTRIATNLRGGGGVDLIHSSYDSFQSSAIAVNSGLFYQDVASNFSFGLSVRNLGTQLTTFNDRREPMPVDVSIGISKKPESFPFQLSLTLRQLNDWNMETATEESDPSLLNQFARHAVFGAETNPEGNLILRFGYNHFLHEQTSTSDEFDLAGFSFGVGIRIKNILVDISRSSYSEIGGILQLSVTSSFL
ncbi:MAG: type IX secretion system protein PorQ [Bacteroidota bacterium]